MVVLPYSLTVCVTEESVTRKSIEDIVPRHCCFWLSALQQNDQDKPQRLLPNNQILSGGVTLSNQAVRLSYSSDPLPPLVSATAIVRVFSAIGAIGIYQRHWVRLVLGGHHLCRMLEELPGLGLHAPPSTVDKAADASPSASGDSRNHCQQNWFQPLPPLAPALVWVHQRQTTRHVLYK